VATQPRFVKVTHEKRHGDPEPRGGPTRAVEREAADGSRGPVADGSFVWLAARVDLAARRL